MLAAGWLLVALGQVVVLSEVLTLAVWLASINLTRHEWRRRTKLVYLQDPAGRFYNPFHRGSAWSNALEAAGLPSGAGGRDWLRTPVFSVLDIPDHALREKLRVSDREFRREDPDLLGLRPSAHAGKDEHRVGCQSSVVVVHRVQQGGAQLRILPDG